MLAVFLIIALLYAEAALLAKNRRWVNLLVVLDLFENNKLWPKTVRARLIAGSMILMALELFILTFDMLAGDVLEMQGLRIWQLPLAYVDMTAKIAVIALLLWGLLRRPYLASYWQGLVAAFEPRRFVIGSSLQLLSFAGLLYYTEQIYADPDPSQTLSVGVSLAWMICLLLAALFFLLSLNSPAALKRGWQLERAQLLLAGLGSLVLWQLGQWVQAIWGALEGDQLAGATFAVAAFLLEGLTGAPVFADVGERLLGIGSFQVLIAPECSGYEGVGLVLCALLIYLFLYRQEFRFPQVLVLLPLGALIVWLLNSVRIATLVAIGHYWSADVAVGGFHSQAGWINFIVTALLMFWLAGRRPFRAGRESLAASTHHSRINLPIACLLPLVVLLASTLISSAFVGQFNYAYPIRVLAVATALWVVWPHLGLAGYRPGWAAWVGMLATSLLWTVSHQSDPSAAQAMDEGLASMGAWAWVWLLFRGLGAVVTVPIAEELAFRGYLLCRLARIPVAIQGVLPLHWLALALSSLAFGALHGDWVAGTLAGLIFAWVRWRSLHIGDAILAHAGANALIFAYAAMSGSWWLI